MDARVASLEAGMTGVKVTLARIEATLAGLSTRADSAAAAERIVALEARMEKVETAINQTIRFALGKAIGPGRLPGVLLACGGVVIALLGALNWIAHQPWFSR